MLAVLSPAKRLDWSVETPASATQPIFGDDARALASVARTLGVADLRRLMHLSEDLAQLTHARFAGFAEAPEAASTRPAALAFAGDTYIGFDAASLRDEDLDWAQDRVRILSGLYGLLRPLDLIQPYRLEMGTRLPTEKGATLYAYWGGRLAEALDAQCASLGTDVVINCASTEYFTAVDQRKLQARVITPVFLDEKDGVQRTVGFFAKKARGAMARHIVQHRLTDPAALRRVDLDGYRFDAGQSTDTRWVFLRAQPAAAAAPKRKRAQA